MGAEEILTFPHIPILNTKTPSLPPNSELTFSLFMTASYRDMNLKSFFEMYVYLLAMTSIIKVAYIVTNKYFTLNGTSLIEIPFNHDFYIEFQCGFFKRKTVEDMEKEHQSKMNGNGTSNGNGKHFTELDDKEF